MCPTLASAFVSLVTELCLLCPAWCWTSTYTREWLHLANQDENLPLVILWCDSLLATPYSSASRTGLWNWLLLPLNHQLLPLRGLCSISYLHPSSTSRKGSVSIPGRRKGEPGFVFGAVLDDPPCLGFLLYNKTSVMTGPPPKIQEGDEIQWRTGSPDTALACHSGRLIHSSCCRSWCQHAKLDLHPSQGPQHSFFRTLVTMCNYIFVLSACHSTQAQILGGINQMPLTIMALFPEPGTVPGCSRCLINFCWMNKRMEKWIEY